MLIVAILAGLFFSSAAYALATAAAGRLCGLTIERVSVGCGPRIAALDVAGAAIGLSLLPLTAGVTFGGGEVAGQSRLEGLSLPASLLVQLAGPTGMLAAAAVLLGPGVIDVLIGLWAGILAIATGAGQAATNAALHALSSAPFVHAAGLVAAGNGAVQLLPIPPLAGGMIVARLFNLTTSSPTMLTFTKVGLAVLIALLALVGFQIYFSLVSSL